MKGFISFIITCLFSVSLFAGASLCENLFQPKVITRSELGELSQKRLSQAESLLGRELSPVQETAILNAHNVGDGEMGIDNTPAKIGNYTADQIRRKTEILKEAEFSVGERRLLISNGIVGQKLTPYDEAVRYIERFPNSHYSDILVGFVESIKDLSKPYNAKKNYSPLSHDDAFTPLTGKEAAGIDKSGQDRRAQEIAALQRQLQSKLDDLKDMFRNDPKMQAFIKSLS